MGRTWPSRETTEENEKRGEEIQPFTAVFPKTSAPSSECRIFLPPAAQLQAHLGPSPFPCHQEARLEAPTGPSKGHLPPKSHLKVNSGEQTEKMSNHPRGEGLTREVYGDRHVMIFHLDEEFYIQNKFCGVPGGLAVKDPALSLLCHRFHPWPWKFYRLGV